MACSMVINIFSSYSFRDVIIVGLIVGLPEWVPTGFNFAMGVKYKPHRQKWTERKYTTEHTNLLNHYKAE